MSRAGRIVVLGEALIDAFDDHEALGGAPFNVVRNLAALGAGPLLVSRVGVDPAGERITAQMTRLGMSLHGLQHDRDHATGRVLVELRDGQPEFRIEPDAAWDWLDSDAAIRVVGAAQPALVYFGTLSQRTACARASIHGALAASAAVRFLDLNLRSMPEQRAIAEASLHLAEILKVNEGELQALFAWFAPGGEAAASESVFALMQRFELRRLIVTRGERGWACYEADPRCVLEGRSPVVTVRDTVGAGDAFAAVLLLGDLRAWPLQATLARAAEFSAAVCTLSGAFDEASTVYRETSARWARLDAGAEPG
jgi:fructokinase